ncbi:MAG: hypothetical protein IPK06_06210 [Ignavibacteriae bacterium]|nr:hypothetical protein [Ignavibacteriota bacterium]
MRILKHQDNVFFFKIVDKNSVDSEIGFKCIKDESGKLTFCKNGILISNEPLKKSIYVIDNILN